MSYTAAITELRQLLSDTAFHKRVTKKKLIGNVNGDNKKFFTYDKRILEDTVEAFVNDAAVSFDIDDAIKGEITLATAPDKNSKVEASYYWQWWHDDDLTTFLNKGAEITSQEDLTPPDTAYLQILPGLKTAALYFAANMATESLISYLATRRHSQEFLLEEDGNDDNKFSQTIQALTEQAKAMWDKAIFHRDDFYKRQGKRHAPAFGVKTVASRRYGPIR